MSLAQSLGPSDQYPQGADTVEVCSKPLARDFFIILTCKGNKSDNQFLALLFSLTVCSCFKHLKLLTAAALCIHLSHANGIKTYTEYRGARCPSQLRACVCVRVFLADQRRSSASLWPPRCSAEVPRALLTHSETNGPLGENRIWCKCVCHRVSAVRCQPG